MIESQFSNPGKGRAVSKSDLKAKMRPTLKPQSLNPNTILSRDTVWRNQRGTVAMKEGKHFFPIHQSGIEFFNTNIICVNILNYV